MVFIKAALVAAFLFLNDFLNSHNWQHKEHKSQNKEEFENIIYYYYVLIVINLEQNLNICERLAIMQPCQILSII